MFMKKTRREVLVKEKMMRKGALKITAMVLAVAFFAAVWMEDAEALEPKLLWEKNFEGLENVELAEISGDVIVGLDKEIIIFDKDGNERFHWGPRVDRFPTGAGISNDGKYFAITTNCTVEYADRMRVSVWECGKVHFYNGETKKELWEYDTSSSMRIFPDGSGVILDSAESGFYTRYADGQRSEYYKDDKFGAVTYVSPDGRYIGTFSGKGNELFSRTGEGLWAKEGYSWVGSITDDAKYVALGPPRDWRGPDKNSQGAVLDREGNVVFERYGDLSGNGTRAALQSDDWTRIMNLPEKTLLKEVPVNAEYARWSHDGRVVALYGNRTDKASASNLFVYDFVGNTEWKANLGMQPLAVTSNGKYLLLVDWDKKIAFYQLY